MRHNNKVIIFLVVLGLLGCLISPAAALAEDGLKITVSDPDRPPGDTDYEGTTVNTPLSVPTVSYNDNQVMGTLRITGKEGVEYPVRVGNKVMVTLPLGSCYMRTPTAENYRHYVSWPTELNGEKNQVCDGDGQPGMRFIAGSPRSITLEVGHIDESGKAMAVDFVFDREGFSTVRVTRLAQRASEYMENPGAPVTRMEFFQMLNDITLFFPSCPLQWADGEKTMEELFSDLEGVNPSEVDSLKPLVDAGVIQGYPDGRLRPSAHITRAEAASLAGSVLPPREELTSFEDELPSWGTGLKNAAHWGLVVGYPDGSFRPDQTITRSEALVLLQKTLESYGG